MRTEMTLDRPRILLRVFMEAETNSINNQKYTNINCGAYDRVYTGFLLLPSAPPYPSVVKYIIWESES